MYKVIVCDPPWPEQGGGVCKRGADRHYPLMKVSEIKALPLRSLADPSGCLLWLWTTGNYLGDAIDCVRAWGFRYVTFRPWVKAEVGSEGTVRPQNPGLGQRTRCDAELVLLCTLGKVPLPDVKHRQTLYAPRTKHSAKPDLFYEQIEKETEARPRLDMFARRAREDWEVFGNQAPDSIDLPQLALDQECGGPQTCGACREQWLGVSCEECNGCGERIDGRSCQACGGTGEAFGVPDAPLAGGYYDQEDVPSK